MPEATFLHIQGRDDSPERVLELPIGPIRIGRGPLCEVRLGEPDLGEVQCLLRRRGNAWHFQPVGPPGRVWIDGRPADQQRPLPIGVPIRVGDHWLTLRSAEGAAEARGSFAAPIPVKPRSIEPSTPRSADPEPAPTGPERPRPAPAEDADERLRRWQTRLDQREQWTKDRQSEKRWEARWKAAGESIRSRSAGPSAAPSPPPSLPPRPTPPPTAPRPPQAPPVARTIEPRPAPSFRRVAEPSPRPSPSRVPLRPMPSPASTPPAAVPSARYEPPAPATRALVALPAPPIDWSGTRVEPVEPPQAPAPRPVTEGRAPAIAPAEPPEDATTEAPDEPVPEAQAPIGEAFVEQAEVLATGEPEAPIEIAAAPADPTEVGPEPVAEVLFDAPEPAVLLEPVAWAVPEPITPLVPAIAAEPSSSVVEVAATPSVTVPAEPAPISAGPGLSRAEWPSARSIFAAQGVRRTAPPPRPAKAGRRRSAEPSPTDVLAPACWTIAAWLGWLPAAAMTLVLGAGGLMLAYEWTLDESSANLAMAMALRPEGAPSPSIDPSILPRGGWWKSTAPHLAAWAVALARAGDGEDHSEDVRMLVEAARHASPLSATTRFAIEPAAQPDGEATPDLAHLGRTRDVVTLTWAGRRLRRAGKVDASLRAYRSALAIAARARRDGLDPPSFDDDRQVRRYRLPREAMIGSVVLDMARAGEWTHEQWVEALPETALAPLVASRVLLKEQKPAEADRLADLAIGRVDAPTPPGLDPAEHRAAVAEGLAYRRRWTDAAEQYRQAIELSDDDATRRRWWLNLAEVAYQVNDDATRTRAIESAKAPDSADEITQRALRDQQGNPDLAARGDRP